MARAAAVQVSPKLLWLRPAAGGRTNSPNQHRQRRPPCGTRLRFSAGNSGGIHRENRESPSAGASAPGEGAAETRERVGPPEPREISFSGSTARQLLPQLRSRAFDFCTCSCVALPFLGRDFSQSGFTVPVDAATGGPEIRACRGMFSDSRLFLGEKTNPGKGDRHLKSGRVSTKVMGSPSPAVE